MKKHLVTILLSVALAAGLRAQTPAPTPPPAYRNLTLPETQRLGLLKTAQAALTPTSNAVESEFINSQIAYLTLVLATDWTPEVQSLAEGLIANKGAYFSNAVGDAMTPTQAQFLFVFGAATKQRLAFASNPDKAAFMLTVIGTLTEADSDYAYTMLNDYYLLAVTGGAADAIAAGQYDAAVATATQPALLGNVRYTQTAIELTLKAKTLAHAPDALSWAKLAYLTASFDRSQDASILVSNAFRALDGNLARANAFITAQTNPGAVNPLAGVDVPAAFKTGGLPAATYAATNLLLQGDKVGALRAARAAYDSASGNDALNVAVGTVAAVLRDIDGNLIRANAYVGAQKAGQSYPIAELQ